MDQPVANQPPRKSGGVLKWVLLGCGGIVLLGVALFGIMGYLAYRSFSTDHAKVEADAQSILSFEKPAGYKGVFAMSMMGVKMASLTSGEANKPGAGSIVLVAMPGGQANQEQIRAQMRENMEKQGQRHDVVEKRKSETFKVRGKDVESSVEVTAVKGSDAHNLQYTLSVDSAAGTPVMLVINGPENTTDHTWVQKFLDTVK